MLVLPRQLGAMQDRKPIELAEGWWVPEHGTARGASF